MSLVAGEVIHIIKCVAVDVKIRRTEDCYSELPVSHRNQSKFLTPITHILTSHGTHRDCSQVLPVMYEIDQHWHRLSPRPIEVIAPQTLQPMKEPEWKYVNPSKLATSGIYTQNDLNDLRDHIMFPAEKSAVLNSVARSMTGKNIPANSISIMGMMNEETLNEIAESAARKFWNGFITFGSFSAGVLAVFIIFKFIKTILDTIIHGYQLHSIYGCGLTLCGAAWSSLTHLLIRRADERRNKTPAADESSDDLRDTRSRADRPGTSEFNKVAEQLKQISFGNLLSKGEGVTSGGPTVINK
ncbi:uncharacterized protein LOC143217882 [Lasioglossum baleicum]|uniref:uncharacterized protein LOC143217882 n=1 Tax=Lasioglossum baleicum TaxID=434251 RepID=UPI003FCC3E31